MRKTKVQKIEEIISIMYQPSEEKLQEVSKNWSVKGIETLTNLWHKYYDTNCHNIISHLVLTQKEKYIDLFYAEECMKAIMKLEKQL